MFESSFKIAGMLFC